MSICFYLAIALECLAKIYTLQSFPRGSTTGFYQKNTLQTYTYAFCKVSKICYSTFLLLTYLKHQVAQYQTHEFVLVRHCSQKLGGKDIKLRLYLQKQVDEDIAGLITSLDQTLYYGVKIKSKP